jgi:hypothetical protein
MFTVVDTSEILSAHACSDAKFYEEVKSISQFFIEVDSISANFRLLPGFVLQAVRRLTEFLNGAIGKVLDSPLHEAIVYQAKMIWLNDERFS